MSQLYSKGGMHVHGWTCSNVHAGDMVHAGEQLTITAQKDFVRFPCPILEDAETESSCACALSSLQHW